MEGQEVPGVPAVVTLPVCDDCDRSLHTPDRQRASKDRLYGIKSVVSGGLPSHGKRTR